MGIKGSCDEKGLRGEGRWRRFKRQGDPQVGGGSEGWPYSSLWGYPESFPFRIPQALFLFKSVACICKSHRATQQADQSVAGVS